MSMRAQLIRIVTFLGGLYFFLKFMLPEQTGFAEYHEQISDGFVLVGGMALALGLINLLMVHGSRVLYLRKDWVPSVALLVGLFSMLAITVVDWRATSQLSVRTQRVLTLKAFAERIVEDAEAGKTISVQGKELSPSARNDYLSIALDQELQVMQADRASIAEFITGGGDATSRAQFDKSQREFQEAMLAVERVKGTLARGDTPFLAEPNKELAAALSPLSVAYRGLLTAQYGASVTKHLYDFLFEGLFISLGAAMFSLLGFYICAAAYRAFRVKSMESLLMMTAALLVMLGQIPFGLWISESLPDLRLWLLQVPSAGAARAIEMGASVAGLVMAFRMWLSIESESFQ